MLLVIARFPMLSAANKMNAPPNADFRPVKSDEKRDLKADKFDEKREVEWTK